MATVPASSAADPAIPKLSVRELTRVRTTESGTTLTVVDRVSFDVATGDFVCLLGPSGSGKTAILNVLAGLDRPDSGEVLLDGSPILGPGPDRAVLFQEPALFPWLSVRGNVELGLRLKGVAAGERASRAEEWIRSVGLDRFKDARPHELSAGMRQRAALARALACDPDVLLGDEPFGALDAQARELLQDELQRLWAASEGRTTVVFVTHNVREAVLLADRVLVMSAPPGRVLAEVRMRSARPRGLDDVLVGRMVSEIHDLLMTEVDKSVSRETAR